MIKPIQELTPANTSTNLSDKPFITLIDLDSDSDSESEPELDKAELEKGG